MNRIHRALLPGLVFVTLTSASGVARAQSLLEDRPTDEAGAAAGPATQASAAEELQGVSLFAVVPPKPKTFAKHDLIEIIINEVSAAKLEQTLDAKKDYNFDAELSKFPSIRHLLEFQLDQGDPSSLPVGVGLKSKNKFKGDGELERKDSLTARVTAEVIDVKPNGTLVLEARKNREQDQETYTLVLSGVCRGEDVTRQNTIQSSQLANLDVKVQSSGQVTDAGKKGLIPRIFEAIFNF